MFPSHKPIRHVTKWLVVIPVWLLLSFHQVHKPRSQCVTSWYGGCQLRFRKWPIEGISRSPNVILTLFGSDRQGGSEMRVGQCATLERLASHHSKPWDKELYISARLPFLISCLEFYRFYPNGYFWHLLWIFARLQSFTSNYESFQYWNRS